jgi:hypothetical protein
MLGAPLRIEWHANQKSLGPGEEGNSQPTGVAKWAAAVTKLIPGEVVAAYLSGRTILQLGSPPPGIGWWIGWTIFCLAAVLGLRRWMTSDKINAVPAEWSAVCTSMLSFIVWIYSFGDVFELLGWWSKTGSALVLIGWTLVAPLILFCFKKLFRE